MDRIYSIDPNDVKVFKSVRVDHYNKNGKIYNRTYENEELVNIDTLDNYLDILKEIDPTWQIELILKERKKKRCKKK